MLKLISRTFTRLQIRRKGPKVKREETRGLVQADEKFIKLSKKEEAEVEKEVELIEEKKKPDEPKKTHAKEFEYRIYHDTAVKYRQQLKDKSVSLVHRPLSTFNLLNEVIKSTLKDTEAIDREHHSSNQQKFSQLDIRTWEGKTWTQVRKEQPYFNCERIVNENFSIQKRENVDPFSSRRTGAIAYKIGMTSLFDKWGHLIPLTVLQLDRCQVLEVKKPPHHNYFALLVGAGQKKLNKLKKPEIGLFLKAKTPPKMDICEFKIDEKNTLPVGYMVGVRHFSVGQFVDVEARSRGKGFQGVMERWGFKGMPASHGCSLTHRSLGSTGCRQDPGRVWKLKKMPGRGGNKVRTVRRLQVYRIDFERSLVYLRGNVPGGEGGMVKIFDSFYHAKDNRGMLNFPTFVYEKDKNYASILQMEPAETDPTENWEHENAVLSDEEEEVMPLPGEVLTKS